MSTPHQTSSHDQLRAALDLAGLELRASEVHGMVCGEICREVKAGSDPGFVQLVGVDDPDSGAGRAVVTAVDALMAQSRRALDGGFQFSLLLPDDGDSMEERTGAVADWARGFALALLRDEKLKLEDLSEDSAEVVRDLLKISEARPGGDPEEDERALTEIEEYMRVGVQLVFEELHPDGTTGPADGIYH